MNDDTQPTPGPDDPPVHPNKDGADLSPEDQAIPEADQTPALDGDPEDIDLAESPDEVED